MRRRSVVGEFGNEVPGEFLSGAVVAVECARLSEDMT